LSCLFLPFDYGLFNFVLSEQHFCPDLIKWHYNVEKETNLPSGKSMTEPNGRQKKRVLIVDDEDMIRTLLKHVFERMDTDNVEVFLAEDGEEALKIVDEQRPNLILLDVLLPKLNGYDVCQRVRRIPEYSPYVIILTARGSSNDRQRAESMGANDFMTKPFNPSRLQSQLGKIWDKQTK
jgi:two-component system, OmpR family, alkaline phosphatase synthesis response regulator PhoP